MKLLERLKQRYKEFEQLYLLGGGGYDYMFYVNNYEEKMIRQFRKKPVTIDAVQIDGPETIQPIIEWMDSPTVGWQTNPPTIWIDTLEGRMTANDGDWIVRGIDGEYYPCKDSIFVRTYQEV